MAGYRFASPRAAAAAFARLCAAEDATRPRRVVRGVTYLDTFDWRLHRAGARLALAEEGDGACLLWRSGAEAEYRRQPAEALPSFAGDLPAGPLREAVAALAEVRRLFPVARLDLRGRLRRLLDGRGACRVEMELERGTVGDPRPGGETRSLPPALRLRPARLHERDADRLGARVEEEGAIRDDSDLLDRALGLIGRDPRAELPPPEPALDPAMRADEAMKRIHRRLVQIVSRNLEGVRRDLDTEFLHDLRVAARRTRAALAQVPGVFPRAVVERHRHGFAWLGQASGPLRDLDVHLLTLPDEAAGLPEPLREALAPIEADLRRRRRVEHRRVRAALDSARLDRLLAGWEAYLSAPVPRRTSLANAARPVAGVAAERIRRCHRRVLERGRKVREDSPPERLHRLRIECKKLRYLLEFFRVLHPPGEIAPLIGALKKLQNNLGEFNDCAVQHATLGEIAARLAAAGGFPPPGPEAARALLERIERRQAETRRAFAARFDRFSGRRVSAAFERVFGAPPG